MSAPDETTGDAPIPDRHVSSVASDHPVDESALADALASVHADLVDGADAILQYYRSEDMPPPLDAADGLVEVVFVPPAMWNQVPTDLAEETRAAVKAVHAEFARALGASADTLAAGDPLVMPSAEVGALVRAGLSRRQAEVQVLRNAGLTQAEVGDRLGMATNTVKVHCHRVDTKVENAEQLLDIVGT